MISFKDHNNTAMTLSIESERIGELQLLDIDMGEYITIYLNQANLLDMMNYINEKIETKQTKGEFKI